MAQAIRYCKTTDDMHGENVFDCSRPHIMSNPFTHIKDKKTLAKRVVKDRETAIQMYGDYFDKMVVEDETFAKAFDEIYEAFKKFDKIYLGCYCKLTESCHVDYIIRKLNQRLIKEKFQLAKEI